VLDVAGGKIGVDDTQVLYLPYQSTYPGTFILGDGGSSLDHQSAYQGEQNTAVGIGALSAISSGFRNTAGGYRALYSNNTGSSNTALGGSALEANTTGSGNTAVGYQVLEANTDGDDNTVIGGAALVTNTTGSSNTAAGYFVLFNNTGGHGNVAIGRRALYSNTLGQYNTALGVDALYTNTTGDNNTALGYLADVDSENLSNATAIGFNAIVDASNKVRIGDTFVTKIEGQVGFSTPSDSTKKENFIPAEGEDVPEKLSDIWLDSWNYIGHNPTKFRHYGPMAQAFYRAFGNDGIGSIGSETTICATDINGINMIAIQALETRTAELKIKINELASLQKQVELQRERLEVLESHVFSRSK